MVEEDDEAIVEEGAANVECLSDRVDAALTNICEKEDLLGNPDEDQTETGIAIAIGMTKRDQGNSRIFPPAT